MIGTSLGHYEIEAEIGRGGMGVVYRALDTRLGRKVALKRLPQHVASDEESRARFEREARLIASLNHPNIVTIYSFETEGGVRFLTMELVDGSDLREEIARAGLPLDRFFELSIAIADALAAAHQMRVIHRDLKPSNVLLTADGKVKVVDFGLAKLAERKSDSGRDQAGSAARRALTEALTQEGTVVGTTYYMSPEQLRGDHVDYRADIFAAGIIFYELATGRRPFEGPTPADVTSAILHQVPSSTMEVRAGIPRHLARIIGRCLQKEPNRRYQSALDLRNDLDDLRLELHDSGAASREELAKSRPPAWRRYLAAAGLGVVGLLAGLALMRFGDRPPVADPMHVATTLPVGLKPSFSYGPSLAISPDGQKVAYVLESGTTSLLYLKGPQDFQARPIAGTEGARTPFFSPRGQWIGFFDMDDRKLKKVSVGGGEPTTVTSTDSQWGAAWGDDDTIVFTDTHGLLRVSANGGDPVRVTTTGPLEHLWPALLPGNEVTLFTILDGPGNYDEARIAAVPLAGGVPRIVLESAYYPQYSPTGHLIFVQGDSVLAAPFDRRTLEVTGPAVTVLEDVWRSSWTGYADFAFSRTGTLVYVSGGPDPTRAMLVQVDRQGTVAPLLPDRRPYRLPRLSPDRRRLAFMLADREVDIWTLDLEQKRLDRQTDSDSWDAYPVWQPESDWLTFSSMREGLSAIYRKNLLDGRVERLVGSEHAIFSADWSPDGRRLAYWEDNPDTGSDLWVYSPETDVREVFLRTDHNELGPVFSPDGRYIAYSSDETGEQLETYVRPYPEGHPRLRVSTGGGRRPRWGAEGRELYYVVGGSLMAVSLATEPELTAGPPRRLFSGDFGYAYDAAPDGDSFIMLAESVEGDPPMRIHLVANWFEELRRRTAARR